ncbi:alkylmercury lyase [Halobacteriales archaeon SW_10_68_16]|nr:MAG: alkylmercury lyase [Halobacteriales archaeon SW_10_68_16]
MTDNDTTSGNRAEQSCECCGTDPSAESATEATTDRWLCETDYLTATLPEDLRRPLGRLLGVADLCHADCETAHRGTVDGETYHFQCFYDAVVLAALRDGTVEIRTESPDGTVVEARADGADIDVSPTSAAFSFGVDAAVEPPTGDGPTHADVYVAVCPYVKAFPDRAAYEQWVESTAAATVAMPLAGATELASALVV